MSTGLGEDGEVVAVLQARTAVLQRAGGRVAPVLPLLRLLLRELSNHITYRSRDG